MREFESHRASEDMGMLHLRADQQGPVPRSGEKARRLVEGLDARRFDLSKA